MHRTKKSCAQFFSKTTLRILRWFEWRCRAAVGWIVSFNRRLQTPVNRSLIEWKPLPWMEHGNDGQWAIPCPLKNKDLQNSAIGAVFLFFMQLHIMLTQFKSSVCFYRFRKVVTRKRIWKAEASMQKSIFSAGTRHSSVNFPSAYMDIFCRRLLRWPWH